MCNGILKKNIFYLLCVFFFCVPKLGFAQGAGGSPNVYQGIPEYLNTATPLSGKLTLSIPTTTLDYGLASRWSIGINPGFFVLSPIFNTTMIFANTRFRIFESNSLSEASTLYLGGLSKKNTEQALFYALSNNIQYQLNKTHIFDFNLTYFRGKVTDYEATSNDLSWNISGYLVAGKYAYFLGQMFSLVFQGGYFTPTISSENVIGSVMDNFCLLNWMGTGYFWSFETEFIQQQKYQISLGFAQLYLSDDYLKRGAKKIVFPTFSYIFTLN